MELFHFQNTMKILIILLVKSAILISNVTANDVFGCGGFIKSHADLDFSKVEVGLYTQQGSLKLKTDCSPSNGYYFIPLYDKGDYVLKVLPPPGWSFEPEIVNIKFDGTNDMCSQGKDVNFNFKGFGITGRIGIFGHAIGAKGVQVELKSETNEKIGLTYTDNSGIFSFTPIIPGKYVIKATKDKWHFNNKEYVVTVETGNTEIPATSLQVTGFDVQGKVMSDGQPFGNVGLLLYNLKGQKVDSKCIPQNLVPSAKIDDKYEKTPLCIVPTNKQTGEYVFNAVSTGKYLIAPQFDNKNIKFHVKPDFLEVEVGKDTVKIAESFEVTGFSVGGKVLVAQNGKGVSNAKVKLNSREIANTQADGSYTLENIQAGTYTIQVSAEDLEFKDHIVKITLANPSLPNIVVSGFKVCGHVISKNSHKLAITKQGSTYHKEIYSKEGTGDWCIYLENGQYLVQVLTSDEDKGKGIQFFPLTQQIQVNSSPLSGIVFSQLRATVLGDIKCLPDADLTCSDITVTLKGLDVNGQPTGQPSITNVKDGVYSFVNVLPGTYEVTVPMSKLCWESNSFRINIKTAREAVPAFVQTGYVISIVSSHHTMMSYKHQESEKSTEIALNAGLNNFCVLKAGTYDINFSGCHRYDENVATTFSTTNQTPLNINAYKHKNVVKILSENKVDYKMQVIDGTNDEVIDLYSVDAKEDGYFVYKYDFYLEHEEGIKLIPKSDLMLFKPETREIFGGNDCVDVASNFIATKGLLINGKTSPAIEDAKITLVFPKNSELRSLIVVTNDKGEFKFGPIDSSLHVELSAEKESYVFSKFDKATNTFKGHKLCEIIVKVLDEAGNKLAGVLLTLSGAESYRKNLVTGEDGTIKFHSLSPSQYYLKAMMKEYKFEPNSKMIDVKEGATVIEELKGHRVAFSVFGTITSLNGEPFPNVVVEAVTGEKCSEHQEENSSEFNGHFRIRGLEPGCQYKIRVRNDANVDRSIPIEKIVDISNGDIRDVNLIAISPLKTVDVTVRILASQNDYYKTLKIFLYKKGSDTPIHSQRIESPLNPKSKINPGIMVFFPRIPFDSKTYYIELSTSLSDKNYKYSLPVIQFVANSSNYYTQIEFKPELRSAENDLNQNSLSAIILIALVGIIFFKQELAIEVLGIVCSKLSSTIGDIVSKSKPKEVKYETVVDEREIDQLASSINAIKKKKAKKVN